MNTKKVSIRDAPGFESILVSPQPENMQCSGQCVDCYDCDYNCEECDNCDCDSGG